jgi:hypothetical protein
MISAQHALPLLRRGLSFALAPSAAQWTWWTCLAGLLAWTFSAAIFSGENFLYRDAAHFYYPLFKLVSDEWAAGRVPLWNPYENCGTPLAAMGTSSVFYPGKLLFALPISYDAAFKSYVLLHLLLAAVGAFLLARRWKFSSDAAALCGLSYAFGGSVLFQYCNVVFLVSAAWLPFAVAQLEPLLIERRVGAAGWLGAILALMVLGGDPQMSYHVGLLAAGYAWLLWREDRMRVRSAECGVRSKSTKASLPRFALLAIAAVVGLGLSAVQVLPTAELARLSDRAAREQPRSLTELAGDVLSGQGLVGSGESPWYSALLGKSSSSTSHGAETYHFSVGPWRLAEFLWPNVGGRQFPQHRRWFDAIPAEGGGGVWVPSLYMGLVPLLLALAAWRLRRGDVRTRWLSWTVLLIVLASFGIYGPGWLWREIAVHGNGALQNPANAPVGDSFGGVYWLLIVLLPGYADFRYPAKLLVIAALGLSLLAARGWDDLALLGRRAAVTRWRLPVVCGLCSALLLVSPAVRPTWEAWLANAAPNALFGPLQTDLAWHDLTMALVHTVLVALAACVLLRLHQVHPAGHWGRLVLLLTAVELAAANGWMVVTAPARQWSSESAMAAAVRRENVDAVCPERVHRPANWWPKEWKGQSSAARQLEGMAWDRDTLMPRYGLLYGVNMLEAQDTMTLQDHQALYSRVRGAGSDDPEHQAAWLNRLGVKFLILPHGQRPPQEENWRMAADVASPGCEGDARLWVNDAATPRAWVVRDRRTEWHSVPHDATDRCQIVHYDPQRVEIDAELASPGVLVLADTYYPGWVAKVTSEGDRVPRAVNILRTNRILRGVPLPAGRHHVTFRYRPASVIWGAAISMAALLALAAWSGVTLCRRHARRISWRRA